MGRARSDAAVDRSRRRPRLRRALVVSARSARRVLRERVRGPTPARVPGARLDRRSLRPVDLGSVRRAARLGPGCRRGVRLSNFSDMEPCITLLDSVWSDIADLCDGLSDAQWDTLTECPGWTVKDNVAHMIGTERMLAGDQAPP